MISPGQGSWLLETRDGAVMDGAAAEHVREAIPVLAGYADALGIRSFAGGTDLAADLADAAFRAMAALCPVPLINLESAIDHPCQALADWKTLDELGVPAQAASSSSPGPGTRRRCRSPCRPRRCTWRRCAAWRSMVLRPEGFALPEPVMARARRAAALSGGSVRETADRDEALAGAHVLYAKSWTSPVALRRRRGRGRAARRRCATGASTRLVRAGRARTAASCTACRCAATWWCATRCSTGRAASWSARRTTACGRRWRCCTACWRREGVDA